MTKRRCTGQSIVYNDHIYVFGGYTGKYQRSRCIEKYNHQNNTWSCYDLKIDIGIEAAFVMAG
jgi:hypothetical protein